MRQDVLNQLLYFIIAILIIGSIGTWLPQVFYLIDEKPLELKSLSQTLTAYYIAIIVVSCTDLVVKIIKSTRIKNKIGKILLVTLIGMIALLFFAINCFVLWKYNTEVIYFIIIGIIAAYILWWIANWNSVNLNAEDTLGGDPS